MKERVTITIEKKALNLVDSLVGKNNIQNRSQALESIVLSHFSQAGQMKAVIVAGKKPSQQSIQQTLAHFEKAGVEEIIVAGGKNNETLFSLLNSTKFADKATFLKEDINLGTAGIIKSAEAMLQGRFIVVYSDINYSINLEELINSHKDSRKIATIALTIPKAKSDLVDSIRVSGNNVTSFEYPSKSPTKLQNAGIFVFEREALDYFPTKGSLESDVLPTLAKGGKLGGFLFDTSWQHKG